MDAPGILFASAVSNNLIGVDICRTVVLLLRTSTTERCLYPRRHRVRAQADWTSLMRSGHIRFFCDTGPLLYRTLRVFDVNPE